VITTWPPRSVAYRLLSAGIPALAPARSKHLWLTPSGGAAQGARLRVWEYEGGALAHVRQEKRPLSRPFSLPARRLRAPGAPTRG
jgi:hypothetical protein